MNSTGPATAQHLRTRNSLSQPLFHTLSLQRGVTPHCTNVEEVGGGDRGLLAVKLGDDIT